jgi:hypothetical protein
MKYIQTTVLFFTLVAAVLGIYFAEKPPFTHIAAIAVLVATAFGIVQIFRAANEAAFLEQTVSYLARAVPIHYWWKKEIRRRIQNTCSLRGYSLCALLCDRGDPRDAQANSILKFKSSSSTDRTGLLVLTPADYGRLAMFDKNEMPREIERLVFGQWGSGSNEDDAERIAETAEAIYSLPRINEGVKSRQMVHTASTPLVIELGAVRLSFDPATVGELLREPPIRRDLRIAEALEKVDSKVSRFLTVSG